MKQQQQQHQQQQQQQQQQQRKECYSSSDTMFTCLFVCLFIYFVYPFHIFRSLTPTSTNNIPHVSFTGSHTLLLAAAKWMFYCRRFLPSWGNQNVRTHWQKCHIFTTWKNPEWLESRSEFLGTPAQRSLKHIKQGRVEFLIAVNIMVLAIIFKTGAGNGFLRLTHKHHTQETCSFQVEFMLVRFNAFFTSFVFSFRLFFMLSSL